MVNGGFMPRRIASEKGTNWDYHWSWKNKNVSLSIEKKVKLKNLATYSELGSTLILYVMKHY